MKHVISTGQRTCYDEHGRPVPCQGTGQDGEFGTGLRAPTPRFETVGDVATDRLTGLSWPLDAFIFDFPMSWGDALVAVSTLNHERLGGFSDWRLPNRRELRSLVHFEARDPVLPPSSPFRNVFNGWYWTSSTAAINTAYAWYVHMGGGRMFYGRKDQDCIVWPVRGDSKIVPATGITSCFDSNGSTIPCDGTGQDGDLLKGARWPEPRFEPHGNLVKDRLTGLNWTRSADICAGKVVWLEALAAVRDLNRERLGGFSDWRLPNINELESLVDCSRYDPALPYGHPFLEVREFYWSSTTSFYEPVWAWALYLLKGATGVGLKEGPHFYVWAVRG